MKRGVLCRLVLDP